MNRIGLVGINWQRGGPEALARLTIPLEERARRLPEIAAAVEAEELCYLATCNRVEIAFVARGGVPLAALRPRLFAALAGRGPDPGEAERTLMAWGEEGACEHLFLVAAGLDSARPGETEIAGQLRTAYQQAKDLGLIGARLTIVLEEALRVAAIVHEVTAVNAGHVSLAGVAIEQVKERLARTPGTVALVGVSPMTIRCGRGLAGDGVPLVLVNRTVERARELAAELSAEIRALADFREQPEPVEALILATGAAGAVLDRAALERLAARAPSGEPPLVIDMAVPPDIDPAAADAAGIPRIGMKDILAIVETTRRERLFELADARLLVDEALLELRRKLTDRTLSPLLGALQQRYRRTAIEGVERLFRRELTGLGPAEREAVTRWAETLARRFAHIPSLGLRSLAYDAGPAAVEAFLAGLDAGLAEELRRAAGRGPAIALPEEETP